MTRTIPRLLTFFFRQPTAGLVVSGLFFAGLLLALLNAVNVGNPNWPWPSDWGFFSPWWQRLLIGIAIIGLWVGPVLSLSALICGSTKQKVVALSLLGCYTWFLGWAYGTQVLAWISSFFVRVFVWVFA